MGFFFVIKPTINQKENKKWWKEIGQTCAKKINPSPLPPGNIEQPSIENMIHLHPDKIIYYHHKNEGQNIFPKAGQKIDEKDIDHQRDRQQRNDFLTVSLLVQRGQPTRG